MVPVKPLQLSLEVPIFDLLFCRTGSIAGGDEATLKVSKDRLVLSIIDAGVSNCVYIEVGSGAIKEMAFPDDAGSETIDVPLDLARLRAFGEGCQDLEASEPVLVTIHEGRVRLRCGRLKFETPMLGENPRFYRPPPDDKMESLYRADLSAKMLEELATLAKTLGMEKQKSYDLRFLAKAGRLVIAARDLNNKAQVEVGDLQALSPTATYARTCVLAGSFIDLIKCFGDSAVELRLGNDVPIVLRHRTEHTLLVVVMAPRIDDDPEPEDA